MDVSELGGMSPSFANAVQEQLCDTGHVHGDSQDARMALGEGTSDKSIAHVTIHHK